MGQGAASKVVKGGRVPEPAFEEPEEVPDWQFITGLKRTNLDEIAFQHLKLGRDIKRLEEERKKLAEEGKKILIKAGVKSVLVDGNRVTLKHGSSSRLDKEKLVKIGGTKVLRWLEEATVVTPNTSLLVTPPKET